MKRRVFLGTFTSVLAAGAAGLHAQVPAASPSAAPSDASAAQPSAAVQFGFEEVARIAADLARADYVAPEGRLEFPFADLGYDAYRGIRFRREADPWGALGRFGLDLLPPGMLFTDPVRINLIENGVLRNLPFDPAAFDFDSNGFPPDAAKAPAGQMGWSGFRLRTVLNRPGVLDELAVFQGASYFRVIGQGNLYGLSARGLALDTGLPGGEEFPAFREFWITTPAEDAEEIRVLALLDSPSVAGAFEFVLRPGRDTVVATRVALIPRRPLDGAGIAPLTSMFWFGPGDRGDFDDYRPAVHDSDGLQMTTGTGAQLWRALSNPKALQISAFADRDPRGFGLMQRTRSFEDFQDAEAGYERRPSCWVAPQGDWGQGSVVLVEIPVENEFHDNIVSFWRPGEPLVPGVRHDFAYDLAFGMSPGPADPVARVLGSRSGRSVNGKDARSVFIDFELGPFVDLPDPTPVVTASAGTIQHPYVKRLPERGVLRLAFEFRPERADLAELSARLDAGRITISETWLSRWTKG